MIHDISQREGFMEDMLYDYADSAKRTFSRPLGRLIFNAQKIKIGFVSSRRAKREAEVFQNEVFSMKGIADSPENTEEFFRARRETYYQAGVARLIDRTLDRGIGSDSFLAELVELVDD